MTAIHKTVTDAPIFVALYEDSSKVEAAAVAAGCPPDGSFLDYVEATNHRTAKRFISMEAATKWLVDEINARKTLFGVGEILTQEDVARRCRYCTCNGRKTTHRTIVDDEGPAETEALDSDCLD